MNLQHLLPQTLPKKTIDTTSSTGVVMIPDNLSVSVTATANAVDYNGTTVKNLKAKLAVDSGKIKLTETQFRLIDALFKMDASYTGITPATHNLTLL